MASSVAEAIATVSFQLGPIDLLPVESEEQSRQAIELSSLSHSHSISMHSWSLPALAFSQKLGADRPATQPQQQRARKCRQRGRGGKGGSWASSSVAPLALALTSKLLGYPFNSKIFCERTPLPVW